MDLLWWLVLQTLWTVLGIVWWLLVKLFWILVWFLLPLALVLFVLLRVANHVLGREVVRAWLKRHSLRLGLGTWARTRRALVAVSVLPLRVLGWYVLYALWHSFVSLWWTPRWKPWPRAWARRWRERPAARPARGRARAG